MNKFAQISGFGYTVVPKYNSYNFILNDPKPSKYLRVGWVRDVTTTTACRNPTKIICAEKADTKGPAYSSELN